MIEGGRELRRKGGAGILAEMLLDILDGKDAVVDSIRTPGEVEALRKRDDFILIEIRANTETRWERLQSRARAGDPLDKETFMEQEKAEKVLRKVKKDYTSLLVETLTREQYWRSLKTGV